MTRLGGQSARAVSGNRVKPAADERQRAIVSRRGKDVAAAIPIKELPRLDRLTRKEMDRIYIEQAREALEEAREKGTMSHKEVKKRLGL
jgi:hypothetical protein